MDGIFRALTEFYGPTLEYLSMWVWGLPAFFLVIAGFILITGNIERPLTLRGVFDAVFPRNLHAHSSTRVDRWNAIFVFMIGIPLTAFIAINALALAGNLAGFLTDHFGARRPLVDAGWAVAAIQFIVYFLALDFVGYVQHYLCHTRPSLWAFHKAHHTAEALTPWTGVRLHPVEFIVLNQIPPILAGLATGLALYATGTEMHPGTVNGVALLAFVQFFVADFLLHTHVPISYGWMNRILLAPVLHSIHHSAEERHRDTNLAVILTIWDWMFGTLYLPKKDDEYRWGCSDQEFGETNPHRTVRGYFSEPIVSFWKVAKGIASLGAVDGNDGAKEAKEKLPQFSLRAPE